MDAWFPKAPIVDQLQRLPSCRWSWSLPGWKSRKRPKLIGVAGPTEQMPEILSYMSNHPNMSKAHYGKSQLKTAQSLAAHDNPRCPKPRISDVHPRNRTSTGWTNHRGGFPNTIDSRVKNDQFWQWLGLDPHLPPKHRQHGMGAVHAPVGPLLFGAFCSLRLVLFCSCTIISERC